MSPIRSGLVLLVIGAVLLPGPAYAFAYDSYAGSSQQQVFGVELPETTGNEVGPPTGIVPGFAASAAGLLCLVAGGAHLVRGTDEKQGRR